MPRYICKPNNHGFQVFDSAHNTFAAHTWTLIETNADKWAETLNTANARFVSNSRFAAKRIAADVADLK